MAYGSLLQESRRALHARIVEVVETRYADRLGEQVERLAHHSIRGEAWPKAVAYLQAAGVKAAGRSAHREAVAHFDQALGALGHVSERRETLERAVDLRLDLRNSLLPLGEFERMLACLRDAEALATALDDQDRLARIFCYMTEYFWVTGHPELAIPPGQRALALATALKEFAVQVETNFYLGAAYHSMGDYQRSMDFLRWNVTSLEGDLIRERFGLPFLPAVVARTWLVWCLAELGEFAEAISRGEEAIPIAEAVDHGFSVIDAYLAAGLGSLYKGELGRAIRVLERSLAECQRRHIPLLFPWVAPYLGYAYTLSGRVAEAIPLLERAVEQATSMGMFVLQSKRVALLSEAHLLAGRLEEATALAGRALHLAREHKERGQQAYALRLLGEIGSRRDPPDAGSAETHYRESLAIAEELGMRPLVAHCHLGLGTLHSKMGKREEARAELAAAIDLYRSMEMSFWLPRAEAELAKASR